MASGSATDNDGAVGGLLVLEMVKREVGERVCLLSFFAYSFIPSFLYFFHSSQGFGRLRGLGR